MKLLAASLLLSIVAASAADLESILEPLAAPQKDKAAKSASSGDSASDVTLLDDRKIAAALASELSTLMHLDGELRLAFTQPWSPVRLPEAKEWRVKILQAPTNDLPVTSFIRFQVESDGKTIGEWQSTVRAQLLRPVWVASRRLDKGTYPDATVCGSQLIDVLREKNSLVPTNTDLTLYEMAQTVVQQRPLTWKDIVLRPLVRKGDTVEVVASEGAMNITMKGVALSNGRAGDAIMVRNPDSRKEFSARVVKPNTVEVHF